MDQRNLCKRFSFIYLWDLQGWPVFWRGLFVVIAVLAIAWAVEKAIQWTLLRGAARKGRTPMPAPSRNGETRWSIAALRLLLDIINLGAFALAALAASLAFLARYDPMRELVVAVILLVVIMRGVAAVAERLLSPSDAALRLLPVGDGEARRLKIHVTGMAAVVAFTGLSHGLFRLLGLPEPLLQLYLVILGALLAMAAVAVILREAGRRGNGARGNSLTPGLLVLAVVFAYGLWAVNTLLGRIAEGSSAVLAVIVILAIPVIERILAAIFQHLRTDRTRPTPEDAARAEPRLDVFLRLSLHGFLGLFALALFAEAGRFGLFAWFETPLGTRVLRAAIDIGITVLAAAVIWEVIAAWVDRKLAGEAREGGLDGATGEEDAAGEDGASKAATRAQTLLPLVRSFLFFVLIAVVVMIVLSSLGIDIGPLLAGAGVVGIAIGFGAQTLVRDIVSGVFFLIDDAFRIGEYIEMGDLRGEVERISLRSLTLRHHRGALQTIPFGQLRSITNYSRDWAIYKMEFSIEYDSDIKLVKKIIKKIGADLLNDPEHGYRFIEPLKSQGIVALADSALSVRVKFKCKPREQFVLRRVVLERIKHEFLTAGVKFGHPRVIVQAQPGLSDETLTAAAQVAVEHRMAEKPAKAT